MFEKEIAMLLGLLQKIRRNQFENCDMEKNCFLLDVNPNTVQSKSNSNEGYSWMKRYIDEDFMKEKSSAILTVCDLIKIWSDYYGHLVANFYPERFGQECVKVLK